MAVPKYQELYLPFLKALSDGQGHNVKEIRESVIKSIGLSNEDLSQKIPSGQSLIENRIGWTKTYLLKAGAISKVKRSWYQCTEQGLKLLELPAVTNCVLSRLSKEFAEFTHHQYDKAPAKDDAAAQVSGENGPQDDSTPEEQIEAQYSTFNTLLAEELLSEIMARPPSFFEQLVVDLMAAMDYGTGFVTKQSVDGGIDGVINEDRLGFSQIYVQAKRWQPDKSVGRPELQGFFGAMMSPPRKDKGLFITTAQFSAPAREFARANHIILVDGLKLTELMIQYDVGVATQKTYKIKRVDRDYFAEDK